MSNISLTLQDNSIFKDSFESISTIVDEVIIQVDQDGLRLNAIDRSHICFVTLDLKKEIFDEYQCTVVDKLCLDTVEFVKILKRCKKNDTLKLESEENNLIITFEGDVTKKFKIRLIDLDYETPVPPNLNTRSNIICESSQFKDWVADMKLFNENLSITIDNEYLTISTESEFGDSECKYYHGEQVNGTYNSNFSIDKLEQIMKANKFSPYLEIGLGNDMPIKLTFNKEEDKGRLSYLLAPRLSEE